MCIILCIPVYYLLLFLLFGTFPGVLEKSIIEVYYVPENPQLAQQCENSESVIRHGY